MNKYLQDNNYLYIPNFIDSDRAKNLAKDFIKFATSKNLSGDSQIPESHSFYNYREFLELLCEKTPEISKLLGEPVLPTYTYARVYHKGATLERHRDREACEISVTLHLSGDTEWPISIQKPSGDETQLTLASGDGMMYLGCVADHWRDRFEGEEYVQVFMHYVRSRGENAWAVFDKEKSKPAGFEEFNSSVTEIENISTMSATQVTISDDFKPIPLEENIMSFENIISDELCDLILSEYNNNVPDWGPTYVGNGTVDKEIRNVDSILLSHQHVIKDSTIRKKIDDELFKCAAEAIRQYNELCPEAKIEQDSGYELLRYNTGQFYKEHTDSFKAQPRAVSCSFALNDDYEGGEWGFFDNKIKIKPKKGSVVMFPSNFMYPHQINAVTKGTRYSIITWFI